MRIGGRIMNQIMNILALRLRQFAESLNRIQHALDRVSNIEDDNFSPSQFTPSRNESRINMSKLLGTVYGYCLAADDVLEKPHGFTEDRWHEAYNKELYVPEPYDTPDHSTGHPTDAELEAKNKADEIFGNFLWKDDTDEQ